MNITKIINDFFAISNFENIYNESSLQFELGYYLREKLSHEYKIQFHQT
jgi:hypothetical protein